jgi:hypothetical protein
MRFTRSLEIPKTFAILAVEEKGVVIIVVEGVVIIVGPNFLEGFCSSKSNWYGSTSIAFANLSKVDREGAV